MGKWGEGEANEFGAGMGGPGMGRGSRARSNPTQTAFERSRIKGDLTQGEIIARMKVPGTQGPGKATVAYEEMRTLYEQKAEDTVQNETMPLEHKTLIRDYFEAIKYKDKEKTK
jgi:hypothetical protein